MFHLEIDACPSFPKQSSAIFHTYKQYFKEQIVYLYDGCVLPFDEHKSIALLIDDDLQGTGTDFFLLKVFVGSIGF